MEGSGYCRVVLHMTLGSRCDPMKLLLADPRDFMYRQCRANLRMKLTHVCFELFITHGSKFELFLAPFVLQTREILTTGATGKA